MAKQTKEQKQRAQEMKDAMRYEALCQLWRDKYACESNPDENSLFELLAEIVSICERQGWEIPSFAK